MKILVVPGNKRTFDWGTNRVKSLIMCLMLIMSYSSTHNKLLHLSSNEIGVYHCFKGVPKIYGGIKLQFSKQKKFRYLSTTFTVGVISAVATVQRESH